MQEEKSDVRKSDRDENRAQGTNTPASNKYTYVFVGAGLAALIFILGMMSAYVLMNGEKTPETTDVPAEEVEQSPSDTSGELQGEDGDASEDVKHDTNDSLTWNNQLPDTETLLNNERAEFGSTMLYATKTGAEVTVHERNILNGEETEVFTFTEMREAKLDGNLWNGLPASAALSPDGSMIAFVDTKGLKVYDRTSGDINALITEEDPGDPSLDELEPPTWSEGALNAFSIDQPMWSPDSQYIGFAEGYYEGSGFGVVDVETNEYTKMNLNGAGVDIDWAPDNTLLQPGVGGYFARGLLLESVGAQDERVNIAESFGEGDSLFQEARFSPNHQNVVFTFQPSGPLPDDREDSYTLGVVNRDGGDYQKLYEGNVQTPVYAPNNEDVYFIETVRQTDEGLMVALMMYDASEDKIERVTTLSGFTDWVDPTWYGDRYLALTGRHTQGEEGGSRVVVLDMEDKAIAYAGPALDVFADYIAFIE